MPRITVSEQDVALATREQVKAAIGIDGLSGDGKSGLMLEFLHILEPDWNKIHVTDTENRSLSLYVGEPLQSDKKPVGQFHHAKMDKTTGYSPFNYEFFRLDAYKKGCTAVGMDSYTHMWYREGGVLATVNAIEAKTKRGPHSNKYTAWGHPDVVDGKNLIFDLIRDSKVHVVSTIRIKNDYVMKQGDNGAMTVEKVGLKQVQSDGLEYEFDLLLRMISPADVEADRPARVEVTKSRYGIFHKGEEYDITPQILNALKEYLEQGTSRAELDEKMRVELATGLKERILADNNIKVVVVKKFPGKLIDKSLKELRQINSLVLELEN